MAGLKPKRKFLLSLFVDLCHYHFLFGHVSGIGLDLSDFVHHVQAFDDLTEDHVISVQIGKSLQTDVKLAPGGVRILRAGHTQ